MEQREIFLMSDAVLREAIDGLTPEQLSMSVPAMWSRQPDPTMRDILQAHVFDESWIPDVLAGKTADEVGEKWSGDLLGDDPIAAYDKANDAATKFIMDGDLAEEIHFSYGDFPLTDAFIHMAIYRAFQGWSIAHVAGRDLTMPPELVDGLWDELLPAVDQWRAIGVFPEEVPVPDDADKQTKLLGKTGYLLP